MNGSLFAFKVVAGCWMLLTAVSAGAPLDFAEMKKPVRFHDPSTPVKHNGAWWIFSTGNGISTRYSTDLKKWMEGPPVFKSLPAWHREVVADQKGHLWAPDVIYQGGRYLLYYSVSGWGKNVSAIGLATNATLDPKDPRFSWKDEGIVIRSRREDFFNAIDPQIFKDDQNKLWMVFGSFWKGIQLIELDPKTGMKHPKNSEIRQIAWSDSIEAPALTKQGGYYYLFVNWGLCCRGLNSTYEIRMGRSRKITGPYLDAEGRDLATGGGTVFMKSEGDRIGPGHAAFIQESGKTRLFFHYYDKRHNGFATLGDLPVEWPRGGWPKI
jgi:arabinan endo-1,5-alpha-L-arabinosidase